MGEGFFMKVFFACACGAARVWCGMRECGSHLQVNEWLRNKTPVEVVRHCLHHANLVFFDSASGVGARGPMQSLIAVAPLSLLRGNLADPIARDELRLALMRRQKSSGDCGFPWGGLCGWVNYAGDFLCGEFVDMLVYSHESGEWHIIGDWQEHLRAKPLPEVLPQLGDFSPMMTREAFLQAVAQAQQWIAAGDIYQVNLTQQFVATCSDEGSLFSLYEQLRVCSPSPMAAYARLAGVELLSASPELFLSISGQQICTRPIKGTRPRGLDANADSLSAYELQTSSKELAELVMITDLLRNDLGQVCEYGSVRVDAMLQLESFAQVHHLVSTVSGELRAEVDAVAAMAACFPGGSITGAPKKRAMEIIAALEPVARGHYCGVLGYWGYNGESQFNIIIRTLVRERGRVHYHVGAGIVADSVAEMEHEETLQKALGLQLAVQMWREKFKKI